MEGWIKLADSQKTEELLVWVLDTLAEGREAHVEVKTSQGKLMIVSIREVR